MTNHLLNRSNKSKNSYTSLRKDFSTPAALIIVVGILVAVLTINAWLLMLLAGAVHSFWVTIPAFSYGQSFIVMFGLMFIGSFFKNSSK